LLFTELPEAACMVSRNESLYLLLSRGKVIHFSLHNVVNIIMINNS
jgi:hypothetical protein